jgi:hypothetical protein
MLALKGNKIFGSPPLHAHGFYRYVDDGVAFNGVDTYMTSVLPKYDSLVNPDNSKTGFTVAAKLRFDSEAMEYQDEPRFILDSGGHHKGKRGMSLYIDSGKLYAEVETLDRIWTVGLLIIIEEGVQLVDVALFSTFLLLHLYMNIVPEGGVYP